MLKMCCVLCFASILLLSFVNGLPRCSKYQLNCDDGECIDTYLWCDSSQDCSDGSDEKYCKKSSYWNGKDPNKCPSTYFKCNDGPCIPLPGQCDGYDNCDDKSDEKNCEHHSSSKSDSKSQYSKPSSPAVEDESLSETPHLPASSTTRKPPTKLESPSKHFSNSSYKKVHSDLHSSDYPHQLEAARNWLLSQRRDFSWGEETPRAITALYLSDGQKSIEKNESDLLMVKQLEVELSLDMARNGTKAMELTDLALYINALQASCKDPKNFHGENLVRTLRTGVDAAQRETTFVNPSVYLTLCMNNATTYEDARKLQTIFLSSNAAISRIDIQALAMLGSKCIHQNTKYLTSQMHEGHQKQFLHKFNTNVLPGNVYEASLLAQVLQELQISRPELLDLILKRQTEDGSFGDILATYLALPVLAGRSFLQLKDHCDQQYVTEPTPIEVLKNLKRRKISVQYALHYGDPAEEIQTIQMQVPEGINFLDVMRLAQEISPKYRFMLDSNRDVPVVYSIGEIPNDAEKGMFWSLHFATSNTRVRGNAGRYSPHPGNIKKLIPNPNDQFIFWMKSM